MGASAVRLVALALGAVTFQTPLVQRDVDRGDFSNVDDTREVVVRTGVEWATIWRQHTPDRPRPAVDFSHEMVVGVFLGSRNSAGFSAEVASVTDDTEGAAGLLVRYREKRPVGGGVAAQVIVSPFHLVALPTRTGLVRFEKID